MKLNRLFLAVAVIAVLGLKAFSFATAAVDKGAKAPAFKPVYYP